jgi:predicted helicase
MSQLLVHHFLAELDRLRKISGTSRETVVREAFKDLLKAWGKAHDLQFIPEYEIITPTKTRIYPDGALLHSLRVPFGYWEAKDDADDLDAEIEKKFRKGYPRDNIIFEDSTAAVLIQDGAEICRCKVDDPKALEKLLDLFFGYERPEIADFRKAVAQFKVDLPAVLTALRAMVDAAEAENPTFHEAQRKFLKHAQETINPAVAAADVREMLIQHILTEDIFAKVFNDSDFHRQNNVAKALYALEEKFFTGATKKNTLKSLEPYYAAILATAALISTHSEKQAFLKVIYENFYKIYNPKAADRLGVIYTPNEIVRFMIESADWLCEKHFGKNLIDEGVEILDPATGTGTFICELLEHFRGQPQKLWLKYKEELHANEVAILPYYVANLNIEATYAAIAGQYAEFPNLCFVDTLDNVAGLGKFSGHQEDLFGAVSEENVERIKRQNKRKISVIIGNPPYNANQQNENDNNKNRTYPRIDERIKATYIKESTAQKTKGYDMYRRFFRWASDRLDNNGVLAFISNNNFIEDKEADGFRRVVEREFNEIWVLDLKGDARSSDARSSGDRRRREGGNIFGDQIKVGVSITFLVKKKEEVGCRIWYEAVRDYAKADEKGDFVKLTPFYLRAWQRIKPDAKSNWINQGVGEFSAFLPVAAKAVKAGTVGSEDRSIFRLYSLGVSTNRDEWVYDFGRKTLISKLKCLTANYDSRTKGSAFEATTKWSETLKRRSEAGQREPFRENRIRTAAYRPFVSQWLYASGLYRSSRCSGLLLSSWSNQHIDLLQ